MKGLTLFARYWRQRKQGDRDLSAGKARAAADHLARAINCLGRAVPVSLIDSTATVCWQLLVADSISASSISCYNSPPAPTGLPLHGLPTPQVLGLDKCGLLSLLQRLGRDSQDREARWEAAETFHRLHQVTLHRRCSQ